MDLVGHGGFVEDDGPVADPQGRVAASGTMAELLGRRELRLRLDGAGAEAEARLAAAGRVTRSGDSFTVVLPAGQAAEPDTAAVPDLVADLVALGVRVHAVESGRITLEQRLLDILRADPGGDRR
jgi:ABC-2 type transport system ATP-binding protein